MTRGWDTYVFFLPIHSHMKTWLNYWLHCNSQARKGPQIFTQFQFCAVHVAICAVQDEKFWGLKATKVADISSLEAIHCARTLGRIYRSLPWFHRRRSSVNFGGQDIFARKYMHEKLTKCPNFTWYLPEKLTKCPNFTYLPEKLTKFLNFTWYMPEKN